jgi:hypothetical protein
MKRNRILMGEEIIGGGGGGGPPPDNQTHDLRYEKRPLWRLEVSSLSLFATAKSFKASIFS